jgi:hypothetical protein
VAMIGVGCRYISRAGGSAGEGFEEVARKERVCTWYLHLRKTAHAPDDVRL